MPDSGRFVIAGAGLTGASAAKTLREEGFHGRITLIGSETHFPYIRPPLSKDYLSGAAARETVFVSPDQWYAEHDVELLRETRVASLDPSAHRVVLTGGDVLEYDALLLATGSSPRATEIEGASLDGVHYLRTLDDSDALRAQLKDGDRNLVVIGSGWIGMEAAATARTLGNEVTVLSQGAVPLAGALGEELGRVFAELHEENGVRIRPSVTVDRILGDGGKATGVVLANGETIPADLVIVGIGAVPNLEVAESAGLEIDNGVLVDEALKTSAIDVYAAGDIANAYHPLVRMRLRSEHWANALAGGSAAARSMLGQSVSYDDIPYFYTDQFDLGMEYSGFGPLTRGADLVYRGDRAGREFVVFWLAEDRVVAGMNVNVWDVNETVQKIIRSGASVDPVRLADENVPLESLAG